MEIIDLMKYIVRVKNCFSKYGIFILMNLFYTEKWDVIFLMVEPRYGGASLW